MVKNIFYVLLLSLTISACSLYESPGKKLLKSSAFTEYDKYKVFFVNCNSYELKDHLNSTEILTTHYSVNSVEVFEALYMNTQHSCNVEDKDAISNNINQLKNAFIELIKETHNE